MKKVILIISIFWSLSLQANDRFFLTGDGTVQMTNAKTNVGGKVNYRLPDGTFPKQKSREIDQIFGISAKSPESISLRLIALLDHIQEHFKGGMIRIVSGYRSPTYNDGLRKKGRLAAKTSMHIEGMAADIDMDGVDGKTLWEYIRGLDCCGAGYYHGKGIHVDVGNSRFWDETSAKVDQDLGGHNKLLLLRTEWDIYHPGEKVRAMISRVTDYPIGIKPVIIVMKGDQEVKKITLSSSKACIPLGARAVARDLSWNLPEGFDSKDKILFKIQICDKEFPEMPDEIVSNPILISN